MELLKANLSVQIFELTDGFYPFRCGFLIFFMKVDVRIISGNFRVYQNLIFQLKFSWNLPGKVTESKIS